jgi:hypothetical protein
MHMLLSADRVGGMTIVRSGAIEAYTRAVADLRETLAAGAARAAEAVEMLPGARQSR